jgi:hypothetical protein
MSVVANLTHETGDLSQYDDTVIDGGDLSVTAAAALAGTSYGLACLIDDTNEINASKNLTKAAILRYRFYIDPNSLTMTSGTYFRVINIESQGGSYPAISYVFLWKNGANYELRHYIRRDGGAVANDTAVISDAPHYCEVNIVRAATSSSADGTCEWWVDGVSQGSWTGIDNYNLLQDYDWKASLGVIFAAPSGSSGTFYLDELLVNNDGGVIGPVAVAGQPADIRRWGTPTRPHHDRPQGWN